MAIEDQFKTEGLFSIPRGLTEEAHATLLKLSQQHEEVVRATAQLNSKSWGDHHPDPVSVGEVVVPDVKDSIKRLNLPKPWEELALNLSFPQLSYSFQTNVQGYASDPHVDGAPPGRKDAGIYNVLLGAILEGSDDESSGPFLYWPRSHALGREQLNKHADKPIYDALWDMQKVGGPPVSFLGDPRDVVLVHPLLQHAVARRRTPGVRRMAFFRLGNTRIPEGTLVSNPMVSHLLA